MKKVIIIALCVLGICNAHAETMTAQEIILTEIATMLPWDSNDEEKDLIRPNIGQTEFHASIEGIIHTDFTISNPYLTITEEDFKCCTYPD